MAPVVNDEPHAGVVDRAVADNPDGRARSNTDGGGGTRGCGIVAAKVGTRHIRNLYSTCEALAKRGFARCLPGPGCCNC